MDQATQQNAALVEEATAAARSMQEQAERLTEAVALFRLDAAVARPGGVDAAPAATTTAPARRRQVPVRAVSDRP
ncbi:hypothetical protein ACFQGW_04310 [Xanthomonas theicola]|uniref:hypothetical protein n=1 Tax=Xanthomonas theicola TaxID=56464 RepID=UPI001473D369|nr:hypothetical protein G4Q83_04900 [Xanthomonas theicola]